MSVREITKELAGQEDLLFGQGAVSQTRNGTVYSISRIPMVPMVATAAALEALDVEDPDRYFPVVVLLGLTVPGTGWGLFYYDATIAKSTANGTTIIESASASPTLGCWIKMV